jgi:PPOX class probable F420-dependent enzyme
MDPARELEDLRSLLDAPSPAVLMTYRPDGSADVSPVWFRYTGEGFEVVVAKGDSKLRNLARDPRAVLMIFETVPPFRGVKVRADAELDDAHVEDARRSIRVPSRRGDGACVRCEAR